MLTSSMDRDPKTGGTKTSVVGDRVDQDSRSVQVNSEFHFDDALFAEPGREWMHHTRAEKRQERQRRAGLSTTQGQLVEEQQKDPDIQYWKSRENPAFVDTRNGVLCRLRKPRHNLREWNTQVVIPVKYRSDILKMAHDMPMAGHMGVDRTLQQIRKSFWWPRVAKV